MNETRTVHDPFLGKDVQIHDRLIDRLRGNYACGPHLPNGRPEFGWRQFQAPPIQHEAAAEIERLRNALEEINAQAVCFVIATPGECFQMLENCAEISEKALGAVGQQNHE
jgi:hypothetical protein